MLGGTFSQRQQMGNGEGFDKVCFACGSPGHIIYYCPGVWDLVDKKKLYKDRFRDFWVGNSSEWPSVQIGKGPREGLLGWLKQQVEEQWPHVEKE